MLPVERSVNASFDEHPVGDGRAIAGSQKSDIIGVGGRVLLHHLLDELKEEGDIISLALLSIDVPAPLISTGGSDDDIVAEVAEPADVTLATISWSKSDNPVLSHRGGR